VGLVHGEGEGDGCASGDPVEHADSSAMPSSTEATAFVLIVPSCSSAMLS
jgi:hypothetical protein